MMQQNHLGKLVLVPTPIAPEGMLHPTAQQLLQEQWMLDQVMICIEEPKAARRRWLHWGLPRAAIASLHPFNEHNQDRMEASLLDHLSQGGTLYLMSDGGLPAFCDPGQSLISQCHDRAMTVTATPFDHSVALALALSGFPLKRYIFEGFPPRSPGERRQFFARLAGQQSLTVVMDTPYRLGKVLREAAAAMGERTAFLACQLGQGGEVCRREQMFRLWEQFGDARGEFILCLAAVG